MDEYSKASSPEKAFLHDISSPVAAAILVADFLAEAPQSIPPEKLQRSISLLRSELHRLRQLIESRRQELEQLNPQDPQP